LCGEAGRKSFEEKPGAWDGVKNKVTQVASVPPIIYPITLIQRIEQPGCDSVSRPSSAHPLRAPPSSARTLPFLPQAASAPDA
jgi:hypothetical protein